MQIVIYGYLSPDAFVLMYFIVQNYASHSSMSRYMHYNDTGGGGEGVNLATIFYSSVLPELIKMTL